MTATNAQALQAYRASRQLNQNPRDVLTAVHEELYRAVASARYAHEQKKLDEMCANVIRAVRILTVLVTTLNFSAVGRDGAALQNFYQRLLNLMNGRDRAKNTSEAYQSALELLRPLCQEFRKQTQD